MTTFHAAPFHEAECSPEPNPASFDWSSVATASRRVAERKLPEHHAEDLAQEVTLRMLQIDVQSLKEPVRYARKAASNAVKDHLRKKGRSPEVPLTPEDEPSMLGRDEQDLMAKDEVAWLLCLLDSEEERAFLKARLDHVDSTWEEFGNAIGKAAGTAAQQWYRLRLKLLAKLSVRREAAEGRNGSASVANGECAPRLGFIGDVFEQHTGTADMDWAR